MRPTPNPLPSLLAICNTWRLVPGPPPSGGSIFVNKLLTDPPPPHSFPLLAPHSTAIGLDPLSPYFMLMMRNIIPEGSRDSFQSYLQGEGAWGTSSST